MKRVRKVHALNHPCQSLRDRRGLLTPDLDADLHAYRDLYRTTYDDKSATVADLIPAMLESFLVSDRAFAKARKETAT